MTAASEGPLLHIVGRQEWARLRRDPHGVVPTGPAGFVHLSTPTQVGIAAQRHYAGRRDLLLLVLDGERVARGDLRWELGDPPEGDLRFPHLYEALSLRAVVSVHRFLPDGSGRFGPPDLGAGTRVTGGP